MYLFFWYCGRKILISLIFFYPFFLATWALTTQLHCFTLGTVLLTQWTDPFSLQMPSVFPSGYMTCPCLKKLQPCLRLSIAEGVIVTWHSQSEKNHNPFSDPVLGAELQRTHRYSPARVPLHLLPPLPACPTLHTHWQQHAAHYKCVQVSPPCPGVHGLPGGTHC